MTSLASRADLFLAESGPASATPGTDFDYTVTVTNTGPSDAGSFSVSDTLPAGLTRVSGCSAVGQLVTCSSAGLAVGASQVFTSRVHVSASAADGSVV